jgi:hypothetical protein
MCLTSLPSLCCKTCHLGRQLPKKADRTVGSAVPTRNAVSLGVSHGEVRETWVDSLQHLSLFFCAYSCCVCVYSCDVIRVYTYICQK